jgi:hypothetical protein
MKNRCGDGRRSERGRTAGRNDRGVEADVGDQEQEAMPMAGQETILAA